VDHSPDGISALEWGLSVKRNAPLEFKEPADDGIFKELVFGHVIEGPRGGNGNEGNILPALVLRQYQKGFSLWQVFTAAGFKQVKRRKSDADKGLCCIAYPFLPFKR
jgi:hypothetical protein